MDKYLASRQPHEGPWGIVYGGNITPDKETGIGSWPDEEIKRAILSGVATVFDSSGSRVLGVVVAAFYMDQVFIDNISGIIDTDVAIVKDNAVIVSTICEPAIPRWKVKSPDPISVSIQTRNVEYKRSSVTLLKEFAFPIRPVIAPKRQRISVGNSRQQKNKAIG